MRLIVLTFFCFPLLAVGQSISEYSVSVSTEIADASLEDHRFEVDEMSNTAVKFGLKPAPATVKVHPNPSSSDLYVTLSGSGTTGKVIVYDILGNILVEGESFRLSGGSHTWSHNVSSWHTGTYVVRVLQDDAVVKSLRFIKN